MVVAVVDWLGYLLVRWSLGSWVVTRKEGGLFLGWLALVACWSVGLVGTWYVCGSDWLVCDSCGSDWLVGWLRYLFGVVVGCLVVVAGWLLILLTRVR